MLLSFDPANGDYEIILIADERAPFIGSFRVNVNLGNDGATLDRFEHNQRDFDISAPTRYLVMPGLHGALATWTRGDSVSTRGAGFRSAISGRPFQAAFENEDTIAYESGPSRVSIDPRPSGRPTAAIGSARLYRVPAGAGLPTDLPVRYSHYVWFDDPQGDQTGSIDATGLLLTFEPRTGEFEIIMTASEIAPLQGQFRLNVNLWNEGAAVDTFQHNQQDFELRGDQAWVVSAGADPSLTTWGDGDIVSTRGPAFVSGLLEIPFTNPPGQDVLASGEPRARVRIEPQPTGSPSRYASEPPPAASGPGSCLFVEQVFCSTARLIEIAALSDRSDAVWAVEFDAPAGALVFSPTFAEARMTDFDWYWPQLFTGQLSQWDVRNIVVEGVGPGWQSGGDAIEFFAIVRLVPASPTCPVGTQCPLGVVFDADEMAVASGQKLSGFNGTVHVMLLERDPGTGDVLPLSAADLRAALSLTSSPVSPSPNSVLQPTAGSCRVVQQIYCASGRLVGDEPFQSVTFDVPAGAPIFAPIDGMVSVNSHLAGVGGNAENAWSGIVSGGWVGTLDSATITFVPTQPQCSSDECRLGVVLAGEIIGYSSGSAVDGSGVAISVTLVDLGSPLGMGTDHLVEFFDLPGP